MRGVKNMVFGHANRDTARRGAARDLLRTVLVSEESGAN
jgi:hypothetical protein